MSPIWGVILVALSFSQLVDGHCLECKVDVCFILDMSGCASKWNSARSLISNLVSMMDVRPDATQVGLVQFAGEAQPEFDLDDHDNKADVLGSINNLSQAGGCINLSTGLDAVRTDCFGPGHGERAGVRRLVIMITDGKSTERGDDPGAAATSVRNANISIFVVGVDDPDVSMINIIADNVTANTFLPGPVIQEPVILPSGIYIYGSVVTALFYRFKEFCANEMTTTMAQPSTTSPTPVQMTTSIGASCVARTDRGPNYGCENAIDGVIPTYIPDSGWRTEWSPSSRCCCDSEWIKINLPSEMYVVSIGLYQICRGADLISALTISFSNSYSQQITDLACPTDYLTGNCTGELDRTIDFENIRTNYVNLTFDQCCQRANYHANFREIAIYALP